MSTLDATVSMLEAMPKKPANPFVPVSQKMILSDLAESRQQISNGKGLGMEDALERIGKQHGFISHHPFHAGSADCL